LFFCQAEDGIRDRNVTGVQTCALPISAADGDVAGASRRLDDQLDRHTELARALLRPDTAAGFHEELARARSHLTDLFGRLGNGSEEPAALQDEVASFGERLSASLLAAVLAAAGLPTHAVDARRCIVTDTTYGRANPMPADTERRTRAELVPLLDASLVPVLGGYIAATQAGRTTTLGRGGSDYSAALVGAALDAREIQIWTDVSGVLTADPRVVPAARAIPRLSYAEAAELAYFGARVLHPKSIQPATDRGIPVRICNSRAPQDPGTLVDAEPDVRPGAVKAIAHKTGVTVLQVVSSRMLGAYGFLRALFEVFDRHRTEVDVVTTSEVSVSLTLEHARALPAIVSELKSLGDVSVEPDRAIVCVVGEGLRTTPGVAARIFSTVQDINVSLISQGASRVNLTFVIAEDRVHEAVRRLHEACFEHARPGDRPRRRHRPGGVMSELVALAQRLVNIPSASGEVAEAMGSAGARAANAHPRAGECRWLIDGEPTDNKLAAGSKGSLRLSLRTEGVTAHSAYPEQGRSAIDPLLDVLADVRRTPWPTDPFFGDTTLNIGVIAGGSRPNVVAGDARADLQIRLVTDAAPVRQLLERTVDGRARIEYLTAVNPVRLTTVPGFETCLVRFTTDIPHLANWGSPLLIGPGSILDAHTAHERISLEELAAGADMYVRLVRALLCGNGTA